MNLCSYFPSLLPRSSTGGDFIVEVDVRKKPIQTSGGPT